MVIIIHHLVQVIAHLPLGTTGDVDKAVAAARDALNGGWV